MPSAYCLVPSFFTPCDSSASRLDKNYLTSVEQIGMHGVEGLDFSHGGVEALGDQPERVAPLYLVVYG